jgi:hypothetical protein
MFEVTWSRDVLLVEPSRRLGWLLEDHRLRGRVYRDHCCSHQLVVLGQEVLHALQHATGLHLTDKLNGICVSSRGEGVEVVLHGSIVAATAHNSLPQ